LAKNIYLAGFAESKCPVCKKLFIPAPQHVWKVGGKKVCSYTCMRSFEKAQEEKKARRRQLARARREEKK